VEAQSLHFVTSGKPSAVPDRYAVLRLNHYKNRVTGHVHDPSMAKFAKPIAVEVARVLRLVGGQ
jgi:hypothetical protein